MIKTNFLVTKEEKDRILNLHESATKNLYLVTEISDMEADAELPNEPEPTNKSDENIGREFQAKMVKNPNFQSWFSSVSANEFPRFKKRINAIQDIVRGGGVAEPRLYEKLGRYLRKNPEIETQIEEYSEKNPNPVRPILGIK